MPRPDPGAAPDPGLPAVLKLLGASSNTARATISNAAGSKGLATALNSAGTTTISATIGGITNSTLLTVATHNDGFNHSWADAVPFGTHDQTQAMQACNAYINANPADTCNPSGCGCSGTDLCVFNTAGVAGQTRRTWFYGGGAHNGQVTNNSCGAALANWD